MYRAQWPYYDKVSNADFDHKSSYCIRFQTFF